MNNFCPFDTIPKSNFSGYLKKDTFLANFWQLLPPNFCKRCGNNLKCSEILVLVELQRTCNNHESHILPVGNYMFKVNNKNTRARCVICSKLTIKTWCLYCKLWTYFTPVSSVSVGNFEQINVDWVYTYGTPLKGLFKVFFKLFGNFNLKIYSLTMTSQQKV